MTIHLSSEASCPGSGLGRPPSPSVWITGGKNRWDQPTSTVARMGHDFGHNLVPALVVFAVVVFLVARTARRRA